MSHIRNYNEIFKAIRFTLSDKGVLILEDPSLLECLKKGAYDQFTFINFLSETIEYCEKCLKINRKRISKNPKLVIARL